jgi:hypothetical protein
MGLYKRPSVTVEINALKSYGAWLLGVDWCHVNDHVPAYDEHGNELTFKVRANSGMMGVIPAWRLAEFLDCETLRNLRMAQAKEVLALRNKPTISVSFDSAREAHVEPAIGPPATDENPTHREDFTRLLGAAARKPPRED